MFATNLVERMRNQSKVLEEICVFVSPAISMIREKISKGRTGDILPVEC